MEKPIWKQGGVGFYDGYTIYNTWKKSVTYSENALCIIL